MRLVMTNTESENIISLSCSRILFCYSFLKTVSFFFILCLSLCSFCLWSAPLPPARRIHDKAWRPAVDTGFSDTGRLLTALAYFSTLFLPFTLELTFFFFWYDNIQMKYYGVLQFDTAQFLSWQFQVGKYLHHNWEALIKKSEAW